MAINIYDKYKETEYFLKMFLESPKKVQQILMLYLTKNWSYPSFWNDESIKSPIEQIFITAFETYCEVENKEKIFLFPQQEVKCKDKTYYIDFVFESNDYLTQLTFGNEIVGKDIRIAIECDGYNFHQKTKEQVQKDNEREYDLKMIGYDILRFSGSQIFNDPIKCAEDTYNYIIKKIKEN